MADPSKRFCLFNCDKTYDLKIVEEFLVEVAKKYGFKISVHQLYFGLRRMAEVCETTIPTMQIDYAIFVVQANESRLSINEDDAGIGYAKFYRALLQKTGELSLKCREVLTLCINFNLEILKLNYHMNVLLKVAIIRVIRRSARKDFI